MIKKILIYFGSLFLTMGIIVYSVVAFAIPEVRPPMIIMIVLFSLLLILCIKNLIKDRKVKKNKVVFTHEEKPKQAIIQPQMPITNTRVSTINKEQANSTSKPESITTIEQPIRVFSDIYSFKGMTIKSSVYPPRDNFFVFNNNELLFFNALADQFIDNKLVPQNVTLTRMGGNDFEVDYKNKNGGCYVGRINLSFEPKFAVKKIDGLKALKIFTSINEAEEFIQGKENYFIEERKQPFSMQYLIGMTKVESISTYNVQECIDTIYRWIRYINYCKNN